MKTSHEQQQENMKSILREYTHKEWMLLKHKEDEEFGSRKEVKLWDSMLNSFYKIRGFICDMASSETR